MRVNVYKTSVISKTFMKNGLKVLYYHPLSKTKTKSKINYKSLEYYLNFQTKIKQTLYLAILGNLLKLSIFAKDIIDKKQLFSSTQLLRLIINYFLFNIGLNTLTVLMNDFRLRTFYKNNSTTSKSNKLFETTTITLLFLNLKLKTSSIKSYSIKKLSATTTSTLSSSSTFPQSYVVVALFKSSSSNNNHLRTYNNSSKSNKVFLYYTPRDPRLRIFLKTKQISCSRPVLEKIATKNIHKNLCAKKSLLNILKDLCNYGELIGGFNYINNNSENENNNNNHNKSKQLKSVSFSKAPYNNKSNINRSNLNKSIEVCDKYPVELSDNHCVVVAPAVAAIINCAILTISANSLFDLLIIIVAVICSGYPTATLRNFLKFIAISLSFFQIQKAAEDFKF